MDWLDHMNAAIEYIEENLAGDIDMRVVAQAACCSEFHFTRIISIWKRIFTEWFPTSGYELDLGPRQERCYWREDGKMLVEAWVPIIKVD